MHRCQLSRIERETHAFPHRLTQFLKNLISHAISRIFDFWKEFSPISRILAKKFPRLSDFRKNISPIFRFQEKCFPDFPVFGKKFPRFPGFRKKVSPIFRFLEKSFPDFPIFGKSFPDFRFWKIGKPGYDFGFRFEIFISRKMDISSWQVWRCVTFSFIVLLAQENID